MMPHGCDYEVIKRALEWLKQGHPIRLVTVLKTWGSSPRPPGSLMVMRQDGVHTGSVSGGCVEEDLLQRFRNGELNEALPTRIDYGVDRQEATRFGLPCGGRLELLIEVLDDTQSLQRLAETIESQNLITRRVNLHNGKVILSPATPDLEFTYTDDAVTRVFGLQWQMLLIGAGHLSQCVSQMALLLGYGITICDPREEYSTVWEVEGTVVTTLMPDDAVRKYANHERSIVIALTHDPKLDDLALLDALASPAFYVGAIGSQGNCDARLIRLQQMGISPPQLQRLHAPVGLDIGSHTPPEIAVSILAEITALRNATHASIRQTVSAA